VHLADKELGLVCSSRLEERDAAFFVTFGSISAPALCAEGEQGTG
jgi:hypothetical protein